MIFERILCPSFCLLHKGKVHAFCLMSLMLYCSMHCLNIPHFIAERLATNFLFFKKDITGPPPKPNRRLHCAPNHHFQSSLSSASFLWDTNKNRNSVQLAMQSVTRNNLAVACRHLNGKNVRSLINSDFSSTHTSCNKLPN